MIVTAPFGFAHRPWWLSGDIPQSAVVAAYQPKGSVSLAASYINLANPGINNADAGVAPSFNTETGWTFYGSSYLTTGVTPSSAQSFMFLRFTRPDTSRGLYMVAGSRTALGARFYLAPTDQLAYTYGVGIKINVSGNYLTSGVMGIANSKGYLNGNEKVSGDYSGNNVPIIIGAMNDSGTVGYFSDCSVFAVVIGSGSLSSSQIAALSAAMAAL